MTTRKLFCFGHRGARGHEPENTVHSVRKALELGADGIEVDVYFADGELVVIHDDTLARTTNGHGRVMKKTFAYLRSLDAGSGERIPILSEIFDAVDRRALINVELKGPQTAAPVAALIAEYANRRGWRYDNFLVSSFDHARVREIKTLCPGLRIAPLITKVPRGLAKFAEALSAWSLHVDKRYVTSDLVADAHARGLKVFVFTVNQPQEIARMKKFGADGVFSDFPERVII